MEDIQMFWDKYLNNVYRIAETSMDEVKAYCEETGRKLFAGGGEWFLGGQLPNELLDLLSQEVPGLPANDLGSLMPDYVPNSAQGDKKYTVSVGLEGGYLPDQIEEFETLELAHDWAQSEAKIYDEELDFTIRGLGWTKEDAQWLWVCTPPDAGPNTLDTIIMIEEVQDV